MPCCYIQRLDWRSWAIGNRYDYTMRTLLRCGVLQRTGSYFNKCYASNCQRAPDTFGLESTDITSYVQGIRSDVIPSDQSPKLQTRSTSQDKVTTQKFEEYNKWISAKRQSVGGGTISRAPPQDPDHEIIHPVSFGAVRLDADNLPINADVDDSNDSNAFVNPRRQGDGAKLSTSNTVHLEGKSEKPASASSNFLRNVQGMNLPKDGNNKTPIIYQIQPLNDLARMDVWTMLRKNVVFENEFLIAINKPLGLPMHSPSTGSRHTLNDFLKDIANLCQTDQVYPLHRIDKDTTGILLLSKTKESADIIKNKFASRKVKKTYLAITKNCPEIPKGSIKIPIAEGKVGASYRSVLQPDLRKYNIASSQSNCKEAITNFQVLHSRPDCAFLEVVPETGIKHQIRIHLGMALGCPVLGDHKYSHADKLAPQRLNPSVLKSLKISQSRVRDLPIHLHCSTVQFEMPPGFSSNKEPIFIHSRPPKYFMHSLYALGLK